LQVLILIQLTIFYIHLIVRKKDSICIRFRWINLNESTDKEIQLTFLVDRNFNVIGKPVQNE
ncbi:MAG: hypothetical protein J5805_04825, partial [Bacteroidaceae bacterium]|nr:hypothetical protein [Bacteroidaceae bacterium]